VTTSTPTTGDGPDPGDHGHPASPVAVG